MAFSSQAFSQAAFAPTAWRFGALAAGGYVVRRPRKPRKPVKWELPFTLERAEKLVDSVDGMPVDKFLARYVDKFSTAATELRALLRETQERQLQARIEAAIEDVKATLESARAAARRQQEDDDLVVMLFTLARRAKQRRFLA